MNKVLDPISSAKVYPSVPTERKPGNEKSTKNLLASDYTASQKHIKGTLKEQRMVFKGANPEKNRHIGHNKAVLCVAALHVEGSDTIVVSGGEGKLCHVWSLRAGSHIAVLDGHSQRISAMATHVSPTEGPMAISASWDESIRLWFLRDCFSQQTVASRAIHSIVAAGAPGERHSNRVLSLAVVTPTGKSAVLVSGAADNTIKIWSLPRGIYQYELKDKDNVTYFLSLGYYNFRCDTFVVSGCRDNTVKVWALQPPLYNEGEKYARSIPVKVIEGHPSRVHSICVVDLSVGKTSDSAEETAATVITSCRDLVIRVFSLANCALLRVMTGAHNTPITALSWCMSPSGDDAFIISTSEGGYICVWSYLSGEKERYFSGHTDSCTCAFTMISPADPTELLIVSGSTDR